MRIGWKISVTVIAAFALGIVGGVTVAKTAKPEYVLVPAGSAKFAPVDPKNPGGAQMAVLSGDPKTGPTTFLLKLPKGPAPVHWHSSDYYAWTVEGNLRHWLAGKDADAKSNPPGTFWFQPGGSAACVTTGPDGGHIHRDHRGPGDQAWGPGATPELKKWRCRGAGSDNPERRMERVRAQIPA